MFELELKFIIFLRKLFGITKDESLKEEINILKKRIDYLSDQNKLFHFLLNSSIDITKIPPVRGNLRKVQLIKTKLLELVNFVLKKNNITYWLEYGTLLGAARHKGFIPWDDDIDVSVFRKDILKLPEIFQEFTKLNIGFSHTYNSGYSVIQRFFYKNFCIDFFPFEYINKKLNTKEEEDEFIKNWHKIKADLHKKYPLEDFKNGKITTYDVAEEVDSLKKTTFGNDYCENPSTKQLICSPEYRWMNANFTIINHDNIFPLQNVEFENLILPIPVNPIEHLWEHQEYGTKESLMRFPEKYTHHFKTYENTTIDLDKIYNELSNFVDDYTKDN